MSEPLSLTRSEDRTLASCEHVIQSGLETFMEVGRALAKIRDGKLYRAEFKSFEVYCRERWGISKQRSYQLMDAAEVRSNIEKSKIFDPPKKESHAAPLTKLPASDQPKAWERAQEIAYFPPPMNQRNARSIG